MSLIERNSSTWRRRDTFPNILAAGKLIPVGDTTKTCLQEITSGTVTPPVVRKFVNSARPPVETVRVFHGKANDPDIASTLVHGVNTKSSINAGSVINPAPKTRFQEWLRHLHEINYANYQKAPLGRSGVQGPGLPSWLDAEKTTFGVTTLQLSNGSEVINPPKTTHQVKKEADEGHQLYVRSHGSYFVGERVDRKYNCNHYRRDGRFGVPTPHYNDGRTISRSLRWPCDSLMHNSVKLVSKRCDDFREKTQPQTSKVHDPIAETLNVPSDHTFGVLMKPDSFGVGDLLHQTPPGEYLKGKDRQRAVVSAVRQHLKNSNYQNFSSLLEAFRYYDKKGQGKIDKQDLKEVCHQFNMIISDPVLDDLMNYCDVDKDGLIGFMEFSNFLNWKDKLPINRVEQKILTGERKAWTAPANMQRTDLQESSAVKPLIRPEDLDPVEVGSTRKTPKTLSRPRTVQNNFFTSSSLINAVVGGLSPADDRTYGVPTVRADLPAPRIKRLSDRTNYGDEATAHYVLHPPLHSLYGVHEKEFFSPRTKDEIAQIFQKVGLNVADETFEEAWKLASMRHPAGDVCVESFRNVLGELRAN
ncbi:EF-hand domain-containing family member B isoform X2 [Onychostoma macrolepis]|uniref:EF-hand domain-containing protein n=2 Tax=Onychostoma macrolepis TaxID=369639 RepID=A0A7J6C652_9TELE|nr:EF-hand domain-containing family member B isoform X2 [Onychostoma macrolepis]XP_058603430.1 EF-hand domain-containing family member B isoform X2 [Onychostoma macrolepis]XP_058603431.1 EF-hand domain-containing family member B isoform X2 [Onychostoma macrolepis]XP_058603432.1 EF-hand domain-containing family member B isoform X2 [Onychostoma macrolepis]XP_058603433.1 EF-hand domain-containing family member B isoform X2 [Onychostoma macrolepis]XP_058603434.1 EF-hand domain-containing family me